MINLSKFGHYSKNVNIEDVHRCVEFALNGERLRAIDLVKEIMLVVEPSDLIRYIGNYLVTKKLKSKKEVIAHAKLGELSLQIGLGISSGQECMESYVSWISGLYLLTGDVK